MPPDLGEAPTGIEAMIAYNILDTFPQDDPDEYVMWSDGVIEPQPIAKPKSKLGRPRIEVRSETIEAKKPWLALGMSRASWYRRRAEGRLPPPGGDS